MPWSHHPRLSPVIVAVRKVMTLACLALTTTAAVYFQQRNDEMARLHGWETHTYQVLLAGREMRGTLADGGDRADFARRLARLRVMTADNPAQVENLARVEAEAASYFDRGVASPEAWHPLLVAIDRFLAAEEALLPARARSFARANDQLLGRARALTALAAVPLAVLVAEWLARPFYRRRPARGGG